MDDEAKDADQYPVYLTRAMCQDLLGEDFDEDFFESHVDDDGMVPKHLLLTSLESRTDVFLTHDWGTELGVDNHARVAQVNRALQNRGLSTWFDSDKVRSGTGWHTILLTMYRVAS
jgi:hypothetical protein